MVVDLGISTAGNDVRGALSGVIQRIVKACNDWCVYDIEIDAVYIVIVLEDQGNN